MTGVTGVAAGQFISAALRSDGRVVVWGNNTFGECEVPTDLADVKSIAAGDMHLIAVTRDGRVVTWGRSDSGEGMPSRIQGAVAACGGTFHSLILRRDGRVVVTGPSAKRLARPALDDVKAIASGREHCVALRRNGMAVAWGNEEHKRLEIDGKGPFVAIAAGDMCSIGITPEHTLAVYGAFAPSLRDDLNHDIVEVVTGGSFGLIRTTAGEVWLFHGFRGQEVAERIPVNDAMALAAGHDHALIQRRDGSLITIGSFSHGQAASPSELATAREIFGDFTVTAAILSSGQTRIWGGWPRNECESVPASLQGRMRAIVPGWPYMTAILDDGKLGGWCLPIHRDNDFEARIRSLERIVSMDSTAEGVIAVREDGGVEVCSKVAYADQAKPLPADAVKVSCSGDHCLILRRDGTVFAAGDDQYGQVSGPRKATGVKDAVAGDFGSYLLLQDGTLRFFGNSNVSQKRIVAQARGPVAIAAGGYHAVALHRDGSVVACGDNEWNESTVPPGLPPATAIRAGRKQTWIRTSGRATVGIQLTDQTVSYDGLPHGLIPTVPPLEGIPPLFITSLTYDGDVVPPTAPGHHIVCAAIDMVGYQGHAVAVLTIDSPVHRRHRWVVIALALLSVLGAVLLGSLRRLEEFRRSGPAFP